MKRILLVEDDERLAATVADRLRASGYEVATASDARSGASAAVRERPDLLILDVSTPTHAGFAVAERILSLPLAPPVIFMTACGEPGLEKKALDLGASAFFEKPYEAEDLLAAVRGALEGIGWGRRTRADGSIGSDST